MHHQQGIWRSTQPPPEYHINPSHPFQISISFPSIQPFPLQSQDQKQRQKQNLNSTPQSNPARQISLFKYQPTMQFSNLLAFLALTLTTTTANPVAVEPPAPTLAPRGRPQVLAARQQTSSMPSCGTSCAYGSYSCCGNDIYVGNQDGTCVLNNECGGPCVAADPPHC